MQHRALSIMCAFVLFASACGGDDDASPPGDTVADTPSADTEPESAPSTASSSSDEPASPTATDEPANQEPIELVFMAHDFTPREAWDAEKIEAYQEQNAHVTITQSVVPYPAFPDRVKTSLASGTVDIFAESTPLGPFFTSGAVAPVDAEAMGFSDLDELRANYSADGLDPFSQNGVPYAIPNEATAYAMYINTALLEEAGIDASTELPTTWQDVADLSARIVQKDDQGRFTRRGFDFPYPSKNNWFSTNDIYLPLIGQKGGAVVTDDGARSAFDSPETVAAYEFIESWVDQGLGGPSGDDVTEDFLAGRAAMIVIGPWFQPILKEEHPDIYENLVVVPFPTFEDAIAPIGPQLDGYGLMVNVKSSPEKQAEAWKFIAFLTDQQDDPLPYVQRTGLLIPRIEVVENPDGLAESLKDYQVFVDALQRPQLGLFDLAEAPRIGQAIGDAVERVVTGGGDPADAVKQAGEEIEAALESSS